MIHFAVFHVFRWIPCVNKALTRLQRWLEMALLRAAIMCHFVATFSDAEFILVEAIANLNSCGVTIEKVLVMSTSGFWTTFGGKGGGRLLLVENSAC